MSIRRATAGAVAILLALPACSGKEAQEHAPIGARPETACQRTMFEEVPMTLCIADPARHTIRTALKPGDGPPWRSLTAYAASRSESSPLVAFAMNAGMFDDDGQPIGYYVENGKRLHELSRADGPGNFHMKPNGVFFGSADRWEIRTTEDFFAHVTRRPEFGTQSGPMLVIGGRLHPRIDPEGSSLRIRNAVGIDRQGRALFVISGAPVSFGRLARYYRDVLRTPDALYLDGTVSSLWDPEHGRLDAGFPIGPLIVVEKKAKAVQEQTPP